MAQITKDRALHLEDTIQWLSTYKGSDTVVDKKGIVNQNATYILQKIKKLNGQIAQLVEDFKNSKMVQHHQLVSIDQNPNKIDFLGERWIILRLTKENWNQSLEWVKSARKQSHNQGAFIFKLLIFSDLPSMTQVNHSFGASGAIVRHFEGDFEEAVVKFNLEIQQTIDLIEQRKND